MDYLLNGADTPLLSMIKRYHSENVSFLSFFYQFDYFGFLYNNNNKKIHRKMNNVCAKEIWPFCELMN